ncbi:MAG: hypothetical protein HOY69_13835 [Streptomyces sp.]|nr:hypothetical protein [Streptomyces sp.]
MKCTAPLTRRLLVLGAGLLTGVLAVPATATADSSVTFSAQSADACPHGLTQGTLSWSVDPSWHAVVNVSGTLTDQPASVPSGSLACADDGYDSDATFTIYDGTSELNQTVVAGAHEQVDNGVVRFGFALRGGIDVRSGSAVGEKLVIQVCRSPVNGDIKAPTYCGKPVTYYPTYTAG